MLTLLVSLRAYSFSVRHYNHGPHHEILALFPLTGRSISDPAFKALFAEILQLCSSYTNPDPGTPEMHVYTNPWTTHPNL